MLSSTVSVKKREEPSREAVVSELIAEKKGKPGALLAILEEVQELEKFKYLSEPTLRQIAEGMGVPFSQVYSVATFYSFFNLTPQGLHSIVVCRGTACHTRGSLELLETCLKRLGVEPTALLLQSPASTADCTFLIAVFRLDFTARLRW